MRNIYLTVLLILIAFILNAQTDYQNYSKDQISKIDKLELLDPDILTARALFSKSVFSKSKELLNFKNVLSKLIQSKSLGNNAYTIEEAKQLIEEYKKYNINYYGSFVYQLLMYSLNEYVGQKNVKVYYTHMAFVYEFKHQVSEFLKGNTKNGTFTIYEDEEYKFIQLFFKKYILTETVTDYKDDYNFKIKISSKNTNKESLYLIINLTNGSS